MSGTLFPVTPIEASEVVIKVLDKHWGKPLPVAFWAAQRDAYGDGSRRPYVVNGVFPQRLRVKQMDYPERIKRQLARGLVGWRKSYEACDPHNSEKKKALGEMSNFIATSWDTS